MVLAAGLGVRMREVTEGRPKSLIEVAGTTLLDHVLDHLGAVGVTEAVINLHYKGEMIERHLAGRRHPKISFSREDELLETGGGVAHALDQLGRRGFFVANSDTLWSDSVTPALKRLAAAWNSQRMDAMLLLQTTVDVLGYRGLGDFFCDPNGRLHRRREGEVAPFLFTGLQILHPRLFCDVPDGPFSLNLLYDRAQEAGRLYGVVHDGEWFHVGTPEGLADATAQLDPANPRNRR
jgi:MurNAc alpha-1-phosphate uridylyltransferase